MKAHKVEYASNDKMGTVLLDGIDVSDCVKGIFISHEAGELPEVELEIRGVPTAAEIVEGKTRVDPMARILLQKLGWTPPKDHLSRRELAQRNIQEGKAP